MLTGEMSAAPVPKSMPAPAQAWKSNSDKVMAVRCSSRVRCPFGGTVCSRMKEAFALSCADTRQQSRIRGEVAQSGNQNEKSVLCELYVYTGSFGILGCFLDLHLPTFLHTSTALGPVPCPLSSSSATQLLLRLPNYPARGIFLSVDSVWTRRNRL
jgi:hypothetical protein